MIIQVFLLYLQVSNSKTYPNAILLHSLNFNFIIGTSVIQHLINSRNFEHSLFLQESFLQWLAARLACRVARRKLARAGGKTLIASQSREGYKAASPINVHHAARGGAQPCRVAGGVLRLAGVLIKTPPELARYWFRPFLPATIKG